MSDITDLIARHGPVDGCDCCYCEDKRALIAALREQQAEVSLAQQNEAAMRRRLEEYIEYRKEDQAEVERMRGLLPNTADYLDPPDGGDVPLFEQMRRMSVDAARYRFIKRWVRRLDIVGYSLCSENIDARIDEAMSGYIARNSHHE